MRKHILLLIALCLHIAARGQTIASLDDIDLSGLPTATKAKALRYWYDDDGSNVRTVTQLKGRQSLDVSALIEGLHTLHYQVIDENNDVADVHSALFMKMNGGIVGTTAKQLRYWFDDDTSTQKTITATGGTQTLDATRLLDGLHTIHYQVIGSDNAAYHIVSALFMKMGSGGSGTVTAKKLMYWFDDETAISTVDISTGTQMLDASHLMEGLHTIHYQVLCSNGSLTPAQSSLFMRMNFDTESTVAKQLRYWFDDGQTATTASITAGSTMLDASQLIDGLHTVHYQIVDSKGGLGSPASSVFMKMDAATAGTQAKKLRYWFDDDAATVRVVDVAQGTQTLDVSGLLTGIHTLCYQLIDSEGKVGTPYSRLFVKAFDKVVADGQNRVTRYQYWLNKNSQAMQTVTLPNAANPYQLISLLPMQKEPIHSDCFHFEMTNGVPTVYAKNIFHIRFHDAGGYFADADKPFVDYSVKQVVTDFIQLEHGIPSTTTKPAENVIKWYKVEALRGDSLAFKTRQACTLQLFSPSGKELYRASSPEVLSFDGSYAPEDGTYYVAVHDVMSQYDSNITVEYQHIGKYVVLSYTPKEVGVALSYLNMKLDGNGYDKLKEVSLLNDNNEMKPTKITVNSKSKAEFQFTMYGNEPTGYYDLILNFEDGDEAKTLTINRAIKLSDANFGDIAIEVEPTRRARFPYPVVVTVRNTGNVAKMYVPFNLAASFNQTGRMPTNSLSDCSWTSMYTMNFDVLLSPEDEEKGYSPYTITDNVIGTGLPGVVLHGFIPYLEPNESKEYILGFVGVAHNRFNLYAWTGKALNESKELSGSETNILSVWDYLAEIDSLKINSESRRGTIKAPDLDGVNAALDVVDELNEEAGRTARNTVGIGLTLGGIENGLRLRNIHAYTDNDDFAKEVLSDYEASVRNSMPTPGQIGDVVGMPRWLQHLLGLQGNQARNGGPTGGAAPIDIYAPGDPNDIIGYTAESGSKYMKKGTTDVYYTIEFENDPEIANAAAHTIVVTDTLDTKRFDLSTFAAKSVMLGGKVMKLDGEKQFTKRTMDLRPEINVIAQVSLSIDEQKGIAKWTIESLDPMTMDPTDDAMQGVLPVNVNGNGQGEVVFDIKLKPGMKDGDEVTNRAGIIFDSEGTIMTPTWTNIVDGTLPTSRVVDAELLPGGETAAISIEASDEGSGPWRYNVYVQYGSGAWFLAAENVAADTTATVKLYDGIVHHFYCVATDMAGNVEEKEVRSELTLTVSDHLRGDANGDGAIDVADIAEVIRTMAKDTYLKHSDVNGDGVVDVADIAELINIMSALARAAEAAGLPTNCDK